MCRAGSYLRNSVLGCPKEDSKGSYLTSCHQDDETVALSVEDQRTRIKQDSLFSNGEICLPSSDRLLHIPENRGAFSWVATCQSNPVLFRGPFQDCDVDGKSTHCHRLRLRSRQS